MIILDNRVTEILAATERVDVSIALYSHLIFSNAQRFSSNVVGADLHNFKQKTVTDLKPM